MKRITRSVVSRLRRSYWTLPLAGLAALALFGINEVAYDRSRTAVVGLAEHSQVRLQVQRTWRLLLEAEASQRGYLLTGRDDYLSAFPAAVAGVEGTTLWLQNHYKGDAEAAPLLAEISNQAAFKLSELGTTLHQRQNGSPDAWRELLLTDIGREKMEAFQLAAQQLMELESRRLESERQKIEHVVAMGRLGINAMAALSLLGLFLFLRQTMSFDRAQLQHAQALQAERRRLEAEVALRTADLTELARHLQTAREDEKGRLARELHDELGALLTAAKLDSMRLKRMMGNVRPEMEARLQHLDESLNRGIELKRRIIEDLSPSSLRTLGLAGALSLLTREFAARSETPVHENLEPVELGEGAQITAYRLVQEALTNAAKYAGASEIRVQLVSLRRHGRAGALVSVQDDGRGFDPTASRGSAHGLMGMSYRVEAEGGEMCVNAGLGRGTRIEAWLPMPMPRPEPMPEPEADSEPETETATNAGASLRPPCSRPTELRESGLPPPNPAGRSPGLL